MEPIVKPKFTKSDQDNITLFAITNNYYQDAKLSLIDLENGIKSMEEAIEEIELLLDDDVTIPISYGQQYVYMKQDMAVQTLNDRIERQKVKVSAKKLQLASYEDTLSQLRSKLYAKLGPTINLDYEKA